MSKYIVCAYYTIDTPYEQEVKILEASLKKLNIPYDIEGVSNKGKWEFNCGIKPSFIRKMIDKHDCTIMYVDADAVFSKAPRLAEDFEGDFAVHLRRKHEILSGTLIFKNNKVSRMILDEWIRQQESDPNEWDQRVLHKVLNTLAGKFDRKQLPIEYIKIFDINADVKFPVITHNQASRRFKHAVALNANVVLEMPQSIKSAGYRKLRDGSFTVLRPKAKDLKYLNENYIHLGGKNWWPLSPRDEYLDSVKDKYAGKTCYIIGKGPSLDNLQADTFKDEDAIVIAINESYNVVKDLGISNKIIHTQLDDWDGQLTEPDDNEILVSPKVKRLYPNGQVINPIMLCGTQTPPSVVFAIKMAYHYGCRDLVFVSFDACVTAETDYAKSIGRESSDRGDPNRFIGFCKDIATATKGESEWITPAKKTEKL